MKLAEKRISLTSSRKLDHLRICLENSIERGFTGFEDVRLVHNALPECNMDLIETRTRFLGHWFESPLFIAAMTGGHGDTGVVNARLAKVAQEYGIAMGVGSQRAALENPDLEETFSVVRDEAPDAFIVANLGIVQLREHGIEWADRAVSMIKGNAIAIHLNFLQEAIQPEGDHDATGCLEALRRLCEDFKYPVIIKETGSGISAQVASAAFGAGVKAIDIGGWGGTSWAAIESIRAVESPSTGDKKLIGLGQEFTDWGIPTVVSLCDVSRIGGPVIATGGLRSGMDIAKAVVLGADLCGMALPLLKPAIESEQSLFNTIDTIEHQLKVAMFLTGSRTIADLKSKKAIITGITREMVDSIMEEYNGY
jgi:isopentenyl-diphosphate Delta-isomerase